MSSPESRKPQHTEMNMKESLPPSLTPKRVDAGFFMKEDIMKKVHGDQGRREADEQKLAEAKDTAQRWSGGETFIEEGPGAVDVVEGMPTHLVEAHRPKSAFEKIAKWFRGK